MLFQAREHLKVENEGHLDQDKLLLLDTRGLKQKTILSCLKEPANLLEKGVLISQSSLQFQSPCPSQVEPSRAVHCGILPLCWMEIVLSPQGIQEKANIFLALL